MDVIIDFITTAAIDTLAVIGVGITYVLTSIASFFQYRKDKRIAKRNSTRMKQTDRVPEKKMHFLEAIGGWPGAFLAQRAVNHKKEKKPYMFVFWLIVLVHLLLWGAYLAAEFYFNWI